MNAIKNYLDNMFRNLPNTEEIRRAKSELLQMMEDKFEELIAEGKTENEAVGIVISEFGNLDEVAESVGISKVIIDNKEPDKPMLSMDRVKEYLSAVSSRSLFIPLGVALCIMSVMTGVIAGLISFGNDTVCDILGPLGFFGFIATAVALFIISGNKNKEFAEINKDQVSLGIETCEYVTNERRRFKPTYSTMVAIGVALCILCIIFPIIISAIPFIADDLGAVLFFASIAIGVYLIVSANVRMNGYDRLLSLNGAGKMSEEFIPKEDRKVSKAPIIISIIVVVLVLGVALFTGIVRIATFISSGFTHANSISEEYDIDLGSYDSIDQITIDAEVCSIVISTSDNTDGIEARYEGAEELMPEVKFDNGELVISQDVSGRHSSDLSDGPEVTITFGSDIDVNNIGIDISAGNLEIDCLAFDDITGKFDAGNVEISDSTGSSIDIEASAGNIELNHCDITDVTVDADAGNINCDHIGFENLNVQVDFGNLEINGISDIDYYTIDAECDLGSVEIDGRDQGRTCHSSGTGTGTITVDCNAGSIGIG